MKIDEKLLANMKQSLTVENIMQKATEAGVDFSAEEAQKIIDSYSMVEIDEDMIDAVAGGELSIEQKAAQSGKPCPKCESIYTFMVFCLPNGYSQNICTKCKHWWEQISY